eukprot:Skav231635  [mRNA]  locus=scaffold1135:148321:148986:+ [translate_table: standard]
MDCCAGCLKKDEKGKGPTGTVIGSPSPTRTFRFFKGLRFLVKACYCFLPSLFWAMVLLAVFITMGALVQGSLLQDYILNESGSLEDRQWVWNRYGTAYRSLYTFYEITFVTWTLLRIEPTPVKLLQLWFLWEMQAFFPSCRLGFLRSAPLDLMSRFVPPPGCSQLSCALGFSQTLFSSSLDFSYASPGCLALDISCLLLCCGDFLLAFPDSHAALRNSEDM